MSSLNITIGQYVKGNSFLYKLDPRFKIIATIILMVAIFLVPANSLVNLYILLGFLGVLVLIMLCGRVNLLAILKGLQPILFIGVFTFVLQLIYNPTGNLIYDLNFEFSWLSILVAVLIVAIWFITSKYINFKVLYMMLMLVGVFVALAFIKIDNPFTSLNLLVYSDGLIKGAFFCLRIVLIVVISTMLTMTTSTTDINLGLEWVLSPLKIIKIPVAEFAMMLSLTLRFIPTLLIETEKIMKAQASRGIDFNEGNIVDKMKQIVTLLIPMFVISINRAEDLANAMEARGYIIGDKRTSIDELKFNLRDYLAFGFVLIILVLSIFAKVFLWELKWQ